MLEILIEHLKKYGSITSMEDIQEYGCTRLSHYIYLMRGQGMNIENEIIKTVNRYGQKTHYCRYRLRDE